MYPLKGTTKSALFIKRTLKLFFPIPLVFFMINGATSKGTGNFFSAPLSVQYIDPNTFPIHLLSSNLNHRILPPSVQDHGDLFIYNPNYKYYDDDHEIYDEDSYLIESSNSFNSLRYGPDFSFKPIIVAINQKDLQQISLTSQNSQQPPKVYHPVFIQEPTTNQNLDTESTPTKPTALARYRWTKDNFEISTIDKKSDLNIVADLKVTTDDGPFSFAVSIDLSHLISNPEQEFILLSSSKKDKTNKSSFFFKFSREESSSSLVIELFKKEESNPGKSPIQSVGVINFFIVFSDNPPLPYAQIFNEQPSTVSDSFTYSQARVKQIFLEKWTNKTTGIQPTPPSPSRKRRNAGEPESSQFSFSANEGFWKSICSDPYKVGGFIDTDPKTSKAPSSTSQTPPKTTDTYVKQQTSVYEEFDPIKYSSKPGGKGDSFQPTNPYTIPTPCKDLDNETKDLLKKYAKPQSTTEKPELSLTNEKHEHINWSLTPQPIKDLLEDSPKTNNSSKSKVIQGSFRAWGGSYASTSQDAQKKGIYNSLYEQSNQSTHIFEVTIDKDTVKASLIDHEQLKSQDPNKKKPLNQLPEISTQLQVSIPYSLTIYDPVSNFLKKQWVNLSVPLDLRSIYNQSQYLKEFFVYDMAVNNSRIGTDYSGYAYGTTSKAKNYGLSGTISFSAGLYLDVEGNLKIQLITKTKGFVNTKNPACDLRERKYKFTNGSESSNPTCNGSDSNWSYRKHNHIPSFIVLEIHEDPKVSSFYLDRRVASQIIDSESTETKGVTKDQNDNIETLEEFKTKKLSTPEHTIVRTMDQTNNAEVYFEKLDVTDPKSPELQKASNVQINEGKAVPMETASGSFWSSAKNYLATYYVPRRNYGEITIDEDSNLNEITIHLKGSTSLGGEFLQSMHYGTRVTYCTSEKETVKVTQGTDKHQCGDGIDYEKIEKDKSTPEFKTDRKREIKISFDELKNATTQANSKKFNFQTVINRAKDGEDNADKNKFDSSKEKLEFLFKESGSFKQGETATDKLPKYSLVGVWYTLELWWDQDKKKICYHTKVRAISAVAEISKKSATLDNSEAHKVVGASARAGFEISKMEFKYKKSPS